MPAFGHEEFSVFKPHHRDHLHFRKVTVLEAAGAAEHGCRDRAFQREFMPLHAQARGFVEDAMPAPTSVDDLVQGRADAFAARLP